MRKQGVVRSRLRHKKTEGVLLSQGQQITGRKLKTFNRTHRSVPLVIHAVNISACLHKDFNSAEVPFVRGDVERGLTRLVGAVTAGAQFKEAVDDFRMAP